MKGAAIVLIVRFGFYLACAAVAAVMLGCAHRATLIDPVCVMADDTPCKD